MIYGSMRHSYNDRKIKKPKVKGDVYVKYPPPPFKPLTTTTVSSSTNSWYAEYRRGNAERFESVPVTSTKGSCTKPARKEYTGSLIIGISTMHKSNAVPITSAREAKEHARMSK